MINSVNMIANEYASGKDVPLYVSLAPTLIKELSKAISDGKVPTLDPGDVFLARFESRILIIRGVERWYEGMSCIITATELEPTSCHALEGLAVDDVLDKTLEQTSKNWRNNNLLNTLTVSLKKICLLLACWSFKNKWIPRISANHNGNLD